MTRRRLLGVALLLIALGVCAAGFFLDLVGLLQGWLMAWVMLGFVPLGAMALLMVHGLTGGAWGRESHLVWRGLAALLPLLALALLPLLLFVELLFPWAAPPETLPEVVRHKLFYLNVPFFIGRNLFYLALWSLLAWGVVRATPAPRRWYAPGLILWALSLTFFSYDWLMSLDPRFYSDVFGMIMMMFSITGALAVGLVFGVGAWRPGVRLDLANIWLSALLAWAFVAFAQLIIIWSGNLPAEIEWYLARGEGAWPWIGRLSVLLFLIVPFAMLLPTAAKRRAGWLRIAAVSGVLGYLLHVIWLLVPSLASPSPWLWLWASAALVALGSAAVLWLGRDARRISSSRTPVGEVHSENA